MLIEPTVKSMKNNEKTSVCEGTTKLHKNDGEVVKNGTMFFVVLDQNEEDTLLQKVEMGEDGNISKMCDYYVLAWGLQEDGSWNQGHYYMSDRDAAEKAFKERAKGRLTEASEDDMLTRAAQNETAAKIMEIADKYGYKCSEVPYITSWGSVRIGLTPTERYMPNVYWYSAKGYAKGEFKINNSSYGAVSLDEYAYIAEACNKALEMCRLLSKLDLSKLEKEDTSEDEI